MSDTKRCMYITTQHFHPVREPCESAETFGELHLSNFIQRKCQLLDQWAPQATAHHGLFCCSKLVETWEESSFLRIFSRKWLIVWSVHSLMMESLMMQYYFYDIIGGEITFRPFVITFKLGLTFTPSELNPVGVQTNTPPVPTLWAHNATIFIICVETPTRHEVWVHDSFTWGMPAVRVKQSLLHSSPTQRSANVSK